MVRIEMISLTDELARAKYFPESSDAFDVPRLVTFKDGGITQIA